MIVIQTLVTDSRKNKFNSKLKIYLRYPLGLMGVAAIFYYLIRTDWNIVEVIRFIGAILLLWLPTGSWCYVLIQKQVVQPLNRFTFSAIASYALTTLAYFVFSVLSLSFIFYIWQILLMMSFGFYLWRYKRRSVINWIKANPNPRRADWILIGLILVSVNLNINFQNTYRTIPETGDTVHNLYLDEYYHASLAYELGRNTPPRQQVNKAGTKERAYDYLTQLTTMLIGRFSGQTDLLRVQMLYQSSIVEILICLAMFGIVRQLSGSKWAGYIGMSMLYILAIPLPTTKDGLLYYLLYYFYPHFSTNIDLARGGSPEMYSGMLLSQGIVLAALSTATSLSNKQRIRFDWLGILTGLMVAATLRFRLQLFLPLLPIFLFLMLYAWRRSHQKAYLVSAIVAVVGSVLLFAELKSPVYMSDTTNLVIAGNVPTKHGWLAFPLSEPLYNLLSQTIPNTAVLGWLWQVIGVVAYLLLEVISIPILIAIAIYLSKHLFRHWFFNILWFGTIFMSVLAAILITIDYDSDSIGFEILRDTSFFILPGTAVAVWQICKFLQKRLKLKQAGWLSLGLVVLAIVIVAQVMTQPAAAKNTATANQIKLSPSRWQALLYLHDYTSPDAVIISSLYLKNSPAFVSGITGRAVYEGYNDETVAGMPADSNFKENRLATIKELWTTSDPHQFCQVLTSTISTHLIETSKKPLKVQNVPCLQQLWSSTDTTEKVTIWSVKRGT